VEDPRDYDTLGENAYDGAEGENRAHRNLRRFVEAHCSGQSVERRREGATVGGTKVWWESKDGKKTVSGVISCGNLNDY
jgi:hypothetical protein